MGDDAQPHPGPPRTVDDALVGRDLRSRRGSIHARRWPRRAARNRRRRAHRPVGCVLLSSHRARAAGCGHGPGRRAAGRACAPSAASPAARSCARTASSPAPLPWREASRARPRTAPGGPPTCVAHGEAAHSPWSATRAPSSGAATSPGPCEAPRRRDDLERAPPSRQQPAFSRSFTLAAA